jgi:hypothetical protein
MENQRFCLTYTLPTQTRAAEACFLSLEASICYRLGRAERIGRWVHLIPHSRVVLTKMALQGYYEEVIVPPAKVVPPRATERLIAVAELVPLARGSFPVSHKIYCDFRWLRLPRAIPR